jgi:hypothetical protein
MHVIPKIGKFVRQPALCFLLHLCSWQVANDCRHVCRPPNVFEVIAELWNDSTFNPIAPASDCHLDFQRATDCSYELVAGLLLATPQKIEDCLASMRSELIRIIDRWERSGQGEGGRDQEEDQVDAADTNQDNDDVSATSSISSGDNDSSPRRPRNFGSLDRRPPRALQSRAAFLNGKPSYLLYYWEIIDAHQLLQSSVQLLTYQVNGVMVSWYLCVDFGY